MVGPLSPSYLIEVFVTSAAGQTSNDDIPLSHALALLVVCPTQSFSSKPKLTANQQRELSVQLSSMTNATQSDSLRLLKKANWNLNLAVELFFNDAQAQGNANANAGSSVRKAKEELEKKAGAIWDGYKDPTEPLITMDGTMEFFGELGIDDPETDVAVYILSCELGSTSLGEWGRKEWIRGFGNMSVDSVDALKKKLPSLRNQFLSDAAYFRKVYLHTFDLSKAEGAKSLVIDSALAMWSALFPPAITNHPTSLASSASGPSMCSTEFDRWIQFLQESKTKGISRDVWNLFLDFFTQVPATFEDYDDSGAWPSLLDEFVEWAKKKRAADTKMQVD